MERRTPQQKEAALRAFEEEQVRLYKTGRLLAWLIAGVSFAMEIAGVVMQAILGAFSFGSVLVLLISFVLCVLLVGGIQQVRWWFVAGACVSLLSNLALLVLNTAELPPVLVVLLAVSALVNGGMAALLCFSKAVSTYLYAIKNG